MSGHFNPGDPNVLGIQWFPTQEATEQLDEGPAWIQRLPSRGAESIESFKMEARVDPNVVPTKELRTLVEVFPEGDLFQGSPQAVVLVPNSDVTIGTWTTLTGGTTNLYQGLTSPITWPDASVQAAGIRDQSGFSNYQCTVDASAFAGGGSLENARIARVDLVAVAAAINGGFRNIRFEILEGSTAFNPVAPNTAGAEQVSGFGAAYSWAFGELNPSTEMPWTPADLADFDIGGDWTLRCRSQTSSASNTAGVFSLGLRVWYIPVETRVAVARWNRPTSAFGGTINHEIEVDDFWSWPDGGSTWSKPDGQNFLYVWRQARARYFHTGGGLSKDVRWRRQFQSLGSGGNPPGNAPAPSGMVGDRVTFDSLGVATTDFDPTRFVSSTSIAPQTSTGPSIDSQPYTLSLQFLEPLAPSVTIGQRITPTVSATYAGARFPIRPPDSGGGALTCRVIRVSDQAQIGGIIELTADEVRGQPAFAGGGRFIEEFFNTPVPLAIGVNYEIRLSVTGAGWLTFMPMARIGPEASFQGLNGAFVGASHVDNRDLEIALTVAPPVPVNVTAAIVEVCVETWACVTEVEHVEVSWDPGLPLLGSGFERFELQRQVLRDVEGTPCEPTRPSMLTADGATGSGAFAPSQPTFEIGADPWQVIIQVNPDDWTPSGDEILAGQWPDVAGANAWALRILSTGELDLLFSEDGTTPLQRTSTVAPTVPTGEWRYIWLAHTPDDGSGGDETIFRISPDGSTWTQVGAAITSSAVALAGTSSPLRVGGDNGEWFSGDVRDMIFMVNGATVASPDFTSEEPEATLFNDSQNNQWTVTGNAEIVEDPNAPLQSPDDPECRWVTVKTFTAEQATSFVDHEAPRGHDVRYRVRTVGAGGAVSEWVSTDLVAPQATDAEIIFTSNFRPDLECVYDHEPDITWEFLDHDLDVVLPIYGADYQVAFFEPEDRGMAMTTDVHVNHVDLPRDRAGNVIGGQAVFEPLRRITRATDIPHVVVLDRHGNVLRGHVTLSRGQNTEPGNRYVCTVEVTPTTDEPVAVDP